MEETAVVNGSTDAEAVEAAPDEIIKNGMSNNANQALQPFQAFLSENDLTDDYQTSALYQTYEDLRHIRKWGNVRVVKSDGRVYLSGTAPAAYYSVFPKGRLPDFNDVNDATQIVVPIPACEIVSPLRL